MGVTSSVNDLPTELTPCPEYQIHAFAIPLIRCVYNVIETLANCENTMTEIFIPKCKSYLLLDNVLSC